MTLPLSRTPGRSYAGGVTEDIPLFSYGAFQERTVQLITFGRPVRMERDLLPRHTVDYAAAPDVRSFESHAPVSIPVVRPTGNPLDKVLGQVLWLSEDELDAADEYNAEGYRRVRVILGSGRHAWVYLPG